MRIKNKAMLAIVLSAIVMIFQGINLNLSAKASGYDIYVDKSYKEDDSDGSSKRPYKKIEDAIRESASKGERIYIKNGVYEERIALSSGIEITGQDKNKVIIKGSAGLPAITAKNNNALKNITVTGGHTGIFFEGKGSIENCTVKGVSGVAINLAEGSGTVTIKKSNISDNGKGIYAQKGSSFTISGNNFENNAEEGIDIREKTDGSISGNYIANNKEGGIEIVVGGSAVFIGNNTIKKNRASGIAAQFYSQASKTGEISIFKNNISYNGIYGIICKAPSGGDPSKGYYDKSIDLSGNKIERNKRKSISGSCKIIEAVTEEEEKKNQTIESATSSEVSEEESMKEEEKIGGVEEDEINRKMEEEARITSEKKSALENTFAKLDSGRQKSLDEFNRINFEIKNRSKIKSFFFGPDYEKISAAKETIGKIKQAKEAFSQIIPEFENLGDAENKDKTIAIINELENQSLTQTSLISEEEKKFSLFGWLIKLSINNSLTRFLTQRLS